LYPTLIIIIIITEMSNSATSTDSTPVPSTEGAFIDRMFIEINSGESISLRDYQTNFYRRMTNSATSTDSTPTPIDPMEEVKEQIRDALTPEGSLAQNAVGRAYIKSKFNIKSKFQPGEWAHLSTYETQRARPGVVNLRKLGLTEMPTIPEGITDLYIENNCLTVLNYDELPKSLIYLNCSDNLIVEYRGTRPRQLWIMAMNNPVLPTSAHLYFEKEDSASRL